MWYMSKKTSEHIKRELQKLKELKKRVSNRLTVNRLKQMKGFEGLDESLACNLISQLREYAQIVVKQMNRLGSINQKNKSYE